MNPLPQHQALIGVDVIGSARNPGYYLNALQSATDTMLRTAMTEEGVPPTRATKWESLGDGALVTMPSSDLGALFDVAYRLEVLAARRNRLHKPDVRLRIAIHVGPVGDESGYYEPKIAHRRLLDAPVFKQVVQRCQQERTEDAISTALIVSDDAYRAVFGGDHTRLVTKAEFASVVVREKEFSQSAWIRVPGFEARSVAGYAHPEEPGPVAKRSMQNVINGNVRDSVQTNVLKGDITFGAGNR